MEEFKNINIDGVGLVRFVKSKRSRRISLRFKYSDELTVTIPYRLSYQAAEELVLSKADWLRSKMSKAPSLKELKTVFDLNTNFETKGHRLAIVPDDVKTIRTKVSNGLIKVTYPRELDVKHDDVQQNIKIGIEKALRLEAKDWIPFRVKKFSLDHKFKYKDIKFKNAKTRWGSCSIDNNLNFNIHLMALPEYLIDYVVLHELCHTVQKSHGPRFWSLLDDVLGKGAKCAKRIDKDLKKYRIGVW